MNYIVGFNGDISKHSAPSIYYVYCGKNKALEAASVGVMHGKFKRIRRITNINNINELRDKCLAAFRLTNCQLIKWPRKIRLKTKYELSDYIF